MHDQLHAVDVNAAGRDVGGHQNPCRPAAERCQVAVPGRLGEVAVQIHRRHSRFGELLGELARLMFGAHEQDSAPGPRGQQVHQLPLGLDSPDVEDVVGHGRRRSAHLVDRVHDGVGEEAPHQLVDAVVQRGREEQPLSAGRGRRQDAGDTRQEAEIGHVVGLVEHGRHDVVERDQLLSHQILEAPRACHDDVGARAQRSDLLVLGHPAEDGGDAQPAGRSQRLQHRGDLRGQFPGGGQHQAGGPIRPAAVFAQCGHQR